MSNLRLRLALIFSLAVVLSTTAKQHILNEMPAVSGPEMEFTPNKGQWHENIRYKGELKGGYLYLEDHSITYYFLDQDDLYHLHPGEKAKDSDRSIHAHAVKVDFINANLHNLLVPADSSITIKNYYLGKDPSHWASGL